MYLLHVSYLRAPIDAQPHVAPHVAWVEQHFASGTFLLAGPKPSGLGGAIVARAIERPALLALLATDPYVIADVAEYQVIEFTCKAAAPALASLVES
jgi:uncharacterized protein YciI